MRQGTRITLLVLACIGLLYFQFLPPTYAAPPGKNPTYTPEPTKIKPEPTKIKKNQPTPTAINVIVLDQLPELPSLEIPSIAPPVALAAAGNAPLTYWEPISPTEEILAAIDSALVNVWTIVQAKQQEYYTQSNGRYMQGLKSHSEIPADGYHLYPDRFLAHPTDWPATWLDMGILPFSPAPYLFWMDTYSGPWGTGYTFCVEITIRGLLYTRCLNYGGEIWRAHTWQETTP